MTRHLAKIGVFADSTDKSMPIVELAREIEARGYSGLFLNEHPHFPLDRPTTPDPSGHPVAERYWRFWDPYIALAFVAAQTRLEVGPFVSLVGEHDAIALSKAISTFDVLSGGRITVGVGFGWHREEFADHGFPPRDRALVVEETVELMRRMWEDELPEFEGRYRRVSRCHFYPKPLQKPRPPILLGARATDRNLRRVVSWADGWIPQAKKGVMDTLDPELEPALVDLRGLWKASDRHGEPQVTSILFDTATEDLREAVHRADSLGLHRVCIRLHDQTREELLPRLDAVTSEISSELEARRPRDPS